MSAALMSFMVYPLDINVFERILIPLYLFSIIPSFAYAVYLRKKDVQVNYLKGYPFLFHNDLIVAAIVIAPVFMALYYIKEIKIISKEKRDVNN
jgi:hypothetical protein